MKGFNFAIFLTLSRVFIAPIFAFCFIYSFYSSSTLIWLWISLGLMCIIELTDAFDGHIARITNKVSDFGKLLDPLADSLSRQTIFLSFMVCQEHIIPLWMFLLFLYRDGVLSILRTMCAYHGIVLAARKAGKLKAVVQATGAFIVVGICIGIEYNIPWLPSRIWGQHLGFWIMCIPTIVTILSVYDYIVSNWNIIKKMAVSQMFK
jgi:CDP-diacylglycerol--glycerol-3-phosphate 3-phosphatidyltransferase